MIRSAVEMLPLSPPDRRDTGASDSGRAFQKVFDYAGSKTAGGAGASDTDDVSEAARDENVGDAASVNDASEPENDGRAPGAGDADQATIPAGESAEAKQSILGDGSIGEEEQIGSGHPADPFAVLSVHSSSANGATASQGAAVAMSAVHGGAEGGLVRGGTAGQPGGSAIIGGQTEPSDLQGNVGNRVAEGGGTDVPGRLDAFGPRISDRNPAWSENRAASGQGPSGQMSGWLPSASVRDGGADGKWLPTGLVATEARALATAGSGHVGGNADDAITGEALPAEVKVANGGGYRVMAAEDHGHLSGLRLSEASRLGHGSGTEGQTPLSANASEMVGVGLIGSAESDVGADPASGSFRDAIAVSQDAGVSRGPFVAEIGQSALQTRSSASLVSQQIAQATDVVRAQGGGVIEVSLSPEELGTVRISMQRSDTGYQIAIFADRDDTLTLLRRHADLLEQAFREMNLGDADISFSHRDGQAGQDETDAAPLVGTDETGGLISGPHVFQPRNSGGMGLLGARLDMKL